MTPPKNIPASVRQRLLNRAKTTDGHLTSCFNTMPWSDSYTGYPNRYMRTDSFSKGL